MRNENFIIVKTQLLYCPECNLEHEVKLIKRRTKSLIKNQEVEHEETLYYCEVNDEIFETAEMANKNMLNARNAYRKQNGLLTSNEIKEIRDKYKITQEELAILLNLGEKTIARYETKAIQEEAYNTLLVLIKDNYNFALDCLNKNKKAFSSKRYKEIFDTITKFITLEANEILLEQTLENDYLEINPNSKSNGNQKLNISKIKNMFIYFVENTCNVFKVKLMKLFWYADALCFLENNKSISGLVYKHKELGALPIGWDKIVNLNVVEKEDVTFSISTSTQFVSKNIPFNKTYFNESELDILKRVCTRFENVSGFEISNIMHEEDIYKGTKFGELLNYDEIEKLKIKI